MYNNRSKKGSKTFSKKAIKKANMFEKYFEQHYNSQNQSEDDYDYTKDSSFTIYPSRDMKNDCDLI